MAMARLRLAATLAAVCMLANAAASARIMADEERSWLVGVDHGRTLQQRVQPDDCTYDGQCCDTDDPYKPEYTGWSCSYGYKFTCCKPTAKPTEAPTKKPTAKPTAKPTEAPTKKPTAKPTEAPTKKPTAKPTEAPTTKPTEAPTKKPTAKPTEAPTKKPTAKPTEAPTKKPTAKPTEAPTKKPTKKPCYEKGGKICCYTKRSGCYGYERKGGKCKNIGYGEYICCYKPPKPTAAPTPKPTKPPTAAPTKKPTKKPCFESYGGVTCCYTSRSGCDGYKKKGYRCKVVKYGKFLCCSSPPKTPKPTAAPTPKPTKKPTKAPTKKPTKKPTRKPICFNKKIGRRNRKCCYDHDKKLKRNRKYRCFSTSYGGRKGDYCYQL